MCLYKVDDNLYHRKEIQLVKGDVIKLQEKPKQEQAIINKKDQIGKAANNPHVKQLMNTKTPDYQAVETIMNSGKPERAKKKVVKLNLQNHHSTMSEQKQMNVMTRSSSWLNYIEGT